MESLFQELKKAREEKGIPLAQISDVTRISEEYLQAVENGNIKILPQAYVRAFIREYADVVGLDADDVMRKYDATASFPEGKESGPPPAAAPAPASSGLGPPPKKPATLLNASTARIALSLLAVAVLIIMAWNLAGRKDGPATEEVPFQSVVRQEEQRLAPTPTTPQNVAPVPPPQTATTPADSMTLRVTTTDSVWLVVVADQRPPKEYLFAANARASWKARDRFLVTLGNAGAAEFSLDQQQLGPLGKPGAVVRNYELTRKNLPNR
jgi:cytoskeletal protein RodZ